MSETDLINAVDISNWQGELGPSIFTCWKQQGISHVIVRASIENPNLTSVARRQMQYALAAGLDISIYAWVYWNTDPVWTIVKTAEVVHGYPFHTCWLDLEEKNGLPDPNGIVGWVMKAAEECWRRDWNVGIYTGKWWWDIAMAERNDFRHFPLWVAQYDHIPDLTFRPFGGWTQAVMKQYTSTGRVCNITVDLNVAWKGYFEDNDMNVDWWDKPFELFGEVQQFEWVDGEGNVHTEPLSPREFLIKMMAKSLKSPIGPQPVPMHSHRRGKIITS